MGLSKAKLLATLLSFLITTMQTVDMSKVFAVEGIPLCKQYQTVLSCNTSSKLLRHKNYI